MDKFWGREFGKFDKMKTFHSIEGWDAHKVSAELGGDSIGQNAARELFVKDGLNPDDHIVKSPDGHIFTRFAGYKIAKNTFSKNTGTTNKQMTTSAILGMRYFLLTTQSEAEKNGSEHANRIAFRKELGSLTSQLNTLLKEKCIGQIFYSTFYGKGYVGLYGKERSEILKERGLEPDAKIRDYMSSAEMAIQCSNIIDMIRKMKEIKHKMPFLHVCEMFALEGMNTRRTIQSFGGRLPETFWAAPKLRKKKFNSDDKPKQMTLMDLLEDAKD